MTTHRDRILAEIELVEETLRLLNQTMRRPILEKPEWMAAAGFVFNVFTGIENILKNALRARGVTSPPVSMTSHRDLIDLALDQGIVDMPLHDDIDEYRAFRHFFSHGYGALIDSRRLKPLIDRLPEVWERFRQAVMAQLPS